MKFNNFMQLFEGVKQSDLQSIERNSNIVVGVEIEFYPNLEDNYEDTAHQAKKDFKIFDNF